MLTINFFIHLYIFFKLTLYWNFNKNILMYILAIATSTLVIPATLLLEKHNSYFTQVFYSFAWLIQGAFFILFFTLFIGQIIGLVVPLNRNYLTLGGLGVGLILIGYSFINARNISIKRVEIDDFGKELRVVQLTDLHLDPLVSHKRLSGIIERVNSLNPDIVVITGDIVSNNTPLKNNIFSPLKDLEARSYFVSGNHEYYEGKDKVLELIESTGVIVLEDKVDKYKGIEIVGIDFKRNEEEVTETLSKLQLNTKIPSILLVHVPLDPKDKRIKLTLSGHTHFGQIVPFNFLVKRVYPYIKGLYSLEYGYIYVSPGTGTWGPHLRLGSKNEITLLELN